MTAPNHSENTPTKKLAPYRDARCKCGSVLEWQEVDEQIGVHQYYCYTCNRTDELHPSEL